MATINIRVVSDVICPWCYVGKKRLEKAIEMYKKVIPDGAQDIFTISWHPFYLDPSLPKTGLDRRAHLIKKFGADRLEMIDERLKSIGEGEGIHFSLKGRIGNTRDAHRLVQLAKSKSSEIENKVVASLFKTHFEEDGDMTSYDVLVTAGEKAGLDGAEIRQWLEEGKGGEDVDREVEQAYRRGVQGVPDFLINGKFHVSGAQEAEVFLEGFVRAKSGSVAGSNVSDGLTC
ncbi:thioredoxin-like protein [Thozetella sp. PMI_491]|nr:thioredoxin-like protein [Thozetella sp. PMI_491]